MVVHVEDPMLKLEPLSVKHPLTVANTYGSELMKLQAIKDVNTEFHLLTKKAYQTVPQVVAEFLSGQQVDMLCMGSIELGKFERRKRATELAVSRSPTHVLVGSVTDAVLKATSCNFCVVKFYV